MQNYSQVKLRKESLVLKCSERSGQVKTAAGVYSPTAVFLSLMKVGPDPTSPAAVARPGSEVQSVPLVPQPRAVLAVELTEPAPVLLDGRVLLHQQGLGDVRLVVPDHHVALKLHQRRRRRAEDGGKMSLACGSDGTKESLSPR